MLRLGLTRPEISVVADQWGSPTSALDLADGLIAMARRIVAEPENKSLFGIFHMTGSGYTNWAGFACSDFRAGGGVGAGARQGDADFDRAISDAGGAAGQFPAWMPASSRASMAWSCRNGAGAAQNCVKRLLNEPTMES